MDTTGSQRVPAAAPGPTHHRVTVESGDDTQG